MSLKSILMIVAKYPATSGHTTVIDNLCRNLNELGHETAIGAFSFSQDPPFGIKKVKLSKTQLLFNGLDKLDFDIIHPHQSRVLYYLLFKSTSKKIVFHYHGASNKIQEKNFQFAMKLFQNKIDKILSVSSTGISQMQKLVSNIQADVLYNGIDTTNFNPKCKTLEKKGDPQLLFVSSLRPYKKTIFLVEKMPEILKSFPDAHLQIIGEGEDFDKLHKFIKTHSLENNVKLLGKIPQSELPNWYSTCDIYVSSSTFEVCPVPPLEAMSCGKPVVLFDIDSHQEILTRSKSGKIFSNNPKDDFVTKIKQVYENRKSLGTSARNFALTQDWSEISKKLSMIYENL